MEFKDVPGLEKYFSITRNGTIFSKRSGKLLKTRTSESGYSMFTTKFGGRNSPSEGFYVHKLVAVTYLEAVEGKSEVNHKDGRKYNNCVDNLEWVTASENIIHAYNTGLMVRRKGVNTIARLSETDIQYILLNSDNLPNTVLGKMFGVHRSTIARIILDNK